jgi:nucleotide-binding universal stress UspA family protein
MTTSNALIYPAIPEGDQPYAVVVPIYHAEALAEWSVQVALQLAKAHQGRVVLMGMVRVEPEQSLSTGTFEAQAVRALLSNLLTRFDGEPLTYRRTIRVEHEPWRALVRFVHETEADLAVVPWAYEGEQRFFTVGMDMLLESLPCDVVVVNGVPRNPVGRILLPLRGGDQAPRTLEVGLSLAQAQDAQITLLHAPHQDDNPAGEEIYEELARLSQSSRWVQSEITISGNVIPALLSEAPQHDLVVLGAGWSEADSSHRVIGPVARRLRRAAVAPLIVVKSRHLVPIDRPYESREAEALPPTPATVIVDKWFAENTFSSDEFANVEQLVALKQAQGLTISLGLPALNEEETIGTVIETMKAALMESVPLLDEIVLIDSGSSDATVEIARSLGVPVYQHSEILPGQGSYRGKGEALWKSLAVLQGDLIAWIDTDIVNIHPRFIYGILGPLLRTERIQYVKGFYRRPLRVGDTLQAGGGGRVTELVARPLINLFYPELSGIIQPLSGEYAGRRRVLERLPFYTGYGVETGLLLDLVEQHGISSVAQVDLLTRIHHNQPLGGLSRMAFAIIQVFIDHLESRERVNLLSEINRTMKIIHHEADRFSLIEQAITDYHRPPMISLPEYRRLRGLPD